MKYRCTTCGCQDLPPSWRQTIEEFEALSDRERAAVEPILSGLRFYGDLSKFDRGWSQSVGRMIRVLLPTFWDARELGNIEELLTGEPEIWEEAPAGWQAYTKAAEVVYEWYVHGAGMPARNEVVPYFARLIWDNRPGQSARPATPEEASGAAAALLRRRE